MVHLRVQQNHQLLKYDKGSLQQEWYLFQGWPGRRFFHRQAEPWLSRQDSRAAGRWKVVNGDLYISEGYGQLQPVGSALKRNNKGYPIIVAAGQSTRSASSFRVTGRWQTGPADIYR